MSSTPHSLLERLRRSTEHTAWTRFVELYTPLMVSWTRRLDLSPHDAADLIQDIFSVLIQKLPTFEYDSTKSFRAWLKTMLLNRWRNYLRQRGRIAEIGQALASNAVVDATPEFEEAEYRAYLVSRALDIMRAEFETNTWKACWEFVVNDRSAQDVAQELGISVNAVYLAKSRVLRRLREELDGLLE